MKSEITRRQFSDRCQSWFSKEYASWANNHRGWSKMKKKNRKLFKKKYRKEVEEEIKYELDGLNSQTRDLTGNQKNYENM
jgi:hypothetical protein